MSQLNKAQLLKFIRELRLSDQYIPTIYSQGSCYRLCKVIQTLNPSVVPVINSEKDHVAMKLGNLVFDITGEVDNPEDFTEVSAEELQEVEAWSFSRNYMIALGECEYCQEPIVA